MKKILVICPAPRDKRELQRLPTIFDFIFHHYSSEDLEKLIYEEDHEEGKSENIAEIIDHLIAQFSGESLAGIVSSDDYPGSILASILAQKLNLPAPNPEVVLQCQHKYYSRLAQRLFVPEAVPQFSLIRTSEMLNSLKPPFFLKPVKSYFSCFAESVETVSKQKLLKASLPPSNFLEPFNHMLKNYTSFEYDANCWIAEDFLEGHQATIEGFVFDGKVEIMGIFDSIMYPGTICFKRFDYPSKLPQEVQLRMHDIASKCMEGMGFNQGIFNIEFFYNPSRETMHIIEINPRMASQFADLYEKVDGINSYEILLSIATGKKPIFKKGCGSFKIASSCVLREFENKLVRKIPSGDSIKLILEKFPQTRLEIFARLGKRLSCELQDGKSYRYGLIHLGADTFIELENKLDECLRILDIQLI